MDHQPSGFPDQVEAARRQTVEDLEQYILAYSAAAYGAMYAADAGFREDVTTAANPIIGNAMKMALRHLELVQQLRIEADDTLSGPPQEQE